MNRELAWGIVKMVAFVTVLVANYILFACL